MLVMLVLVMLVLVMILVAMLVMLVLVMLVLVMLVLVMILVAMLVMVIVVVMIIMVMLVIVKDHGMVHGRHDHANRNASLVKPCASINGTDLALVAMLSIEFSRNASRSWLIQNTSSAS